MGKKKGLFGLDALILFIAIVIVVGVTAILLITSGNALTQRTLTKAAEQRKQISAGFEIVDIIGSDASSAGGAHTIEDIFITTRLMPGSIHATFNDTMVYFYNGKNQYDIQFNSSCNSECLAVTTTTYNIYYLKRGNKWENRHINLGDTVIIAVKLPEAIEEDKIYSVGIIPLHGQKTFVKFETPSSMVKKQIRLWPLS